VSPLMADHQPARASLLSNGTLSGFTSPLDDKADAATGDIPKAFAQRGLKEGWRRPDFGDHSRIFTERFLNADITGSSTN